MGYGFTTDNALLFFNDQKLNREDIAAWSGLSKKYIRLIAPLKERFEASYRELIREKRVLGVMIREGYMVLADARDKNNPAYLTHPGIHYHPVQPSVERLLLDITDRMQKWDCEYVFVVSETNYMINALTTKLGEKVLFTGRKRREVNALNLEEYRRAGAQLKDKTKKQINDDYLEEIFLLSKCTCLLSGKSSGSVVASLWNDNVYEQMEFYELGIY